MNLFQSKYKPPAWLLAFSLSALVVGCGSGSDSATVAPVDPVADQAGGVCAGAECVDLGSAGSFVILAQTGITNVPTSAITGNVGAHPITGAAIGVTCAEVSGTIYDTDGAYTGGGADDVTCRVTDATLLGTAVNDSIAAFVDARDRPAGTGDNLNLGGGTLSGQTLLPGTYTWDGTLTIAGDITLAGSATDVWILQIGGNLNQDAAIRVNLTSGALSKNVFWQVGGATTNIGSTAHFAGIVITGGLVAMGTGASVDGRLYTGEAVTLQGNPVTRPAP